MRFRDQYDWIVLGNHPAALLSASLVAKLGLSVLALPMGSYMPQVVSQTGHTLDPEPNYFLGLGIDDGQEGLTLKGLNHIGLNFEELKRKCKFDRVKQILTPQTRISFGNLDQLQFEFQREFGKLLSSELDLLNAAKLTKKENLEYWNQFPKRLSVSDDAKSKSIESFSVTSSNRQLVKKLKLTSSSSPSLEKWTSFSKRISDLSENLNRPDLLEIFTGLHFWLTSNLNADPSLFEVLHLLNLSYSGASFQGGLTQFREYLLSLALRLGVHVPPKTDCRRIFIEKGQFAGIQISSKGNMISAQGGILGCSTRSVYSKCTYTGRSWFNQQKPALSPAGWRFTIALTVHEDAILNGMEARLIWQEKDAPPLEIEITDPEEDTVSSSRNRTIYLRTVMPYSIESLQVEFQRLIAARMLRQTMEIMHFIEFHVIKIFPDFRSGKLPTADSQGLAFGREYQADELVKIYGFTSLEEIPDNLLIYSGEGLGSKTGIDGLFVASNESFPGLGSFGSVIAMFDAVSWIARQSGLKGPFG